MLTFLYGTLSLFLFFTPIKFRSSIIVSWTKVIILWLRITCGIRYQMIGSENIPQNGKPLVILSKHQSTWETLFLQGWFNPAATVLKKQLLRIPFFGWGLAALNPIAIDREKPRDALRKVKEKGIERLKSGFNLILFPEGTRIVPGQSGSYARSGADIAIATKSDILPIAVNAGHYWQPGKFVKKPGLITVSLGPPISVENTNSKNLMEKVKDWIETEMQRIEQESTTL